ncbi:MAG: AbrB/MazE/SpoVT family DNA-binding domain-containing protein [Gammaproteobacteria bacterium]|nr:AbrB/MazE/SpoVT family DNA-binding domain-containing protein [Gammaproteobacteria bacterium]
MAKVTSKLQVTIPKAIAQAHGIKPGDKISFESAGEIIRVRSEIQPTKKVRSKAERMRLFNEMVERQREREKNRCFPTGFPKDDEVTREALYDRVNTD